MRMAHPERRLPRQKGSLHEGASGYPVSGSRNTATKILLDGQTLRRQSVMTDPIQKYPRPPFEAQPQSFPGKTGKMEPEPDHGEES